MPKSGFALETTVAEKLYEAIEKALPKVSPRDKAEVAQIVINTLARLSISDLAKFNNGMVDYITLSDRSKQDVLSMICVKVTEFKIG